MRRPGIFLLLHCFVLSLAITGAHAERYRENPSTSPGSLVTAMRDVAQALTDAHAGYSRIMERRAALDSESRRLQSEQAALRQAEADLRAGTLDPKHMDNQWPQTRREKLAAEVEAFGRRVQAYNLESARFNRKVAKLTPILMNHPPDTVPQLVARLNSLSARVETLRGQNRFDRAQALIESHRALLSSVNLLGP